ncbi:Protein of unknown function [Actinokineospora alba]|uniref:DUF2716 domain-containing protein n=1 Tax=Actinokineospora alba TaxID=504798 RepID=A0A1H0NPH0_9PSEU|nr:DUF2716 domain-containing protein [Actinokineospora alba]TDP68797.1 uncharacterized protein DUF2716 [Actinokineospora alba]SDH86844.1 Protein of unknown function [Actinokineospora alba]SDO94662.1 Protein of unknown function [Actinokineospora alba]
METSVTRLSDEPDHRELWNRIHRDFHFRPHTAAFPGIAEPSDSITWRLPDTESGIDRLQALVESGLRTCTPPGEDLYWLDWQHEGFRFDPHRVGGVGQPSWPGGCFPDGDYFLYTSDDLRHGTFGHPWESTLCVYGADLLDRVAQPITEILGTAVRRGGKG